MAGGKSSAAKIRLAERRQKAFSLRKSGASLRAVAKAIAAEFEQPGYNESAASKDVRFVLAELVELSQAEAEEFRQLELERLDVAQIAIARQVQTGDLQAIDRWLRIIDRRCKLLGLDLPPMERSTHEDTATGIELEIITSAS